MTPDITSSAKSAARVALRQLPDPAPLPRVLRDEEVDGHRSVWCSHYDDCLDQAERKGWASFSCAKCPLHAGPPVEEIKGEEPEEFEVPRHRPIALVKQILWLLAREDRGWSAGQIAAELNRRSQVLSINAALSKLVRQGRIKRCGSGRYEAA